MFFCYLDESGDDGITNSPSDFFVVSAIYFQSNEWHDLYNKHKELRESINTDFDLPLSVELHANPLIRNKKPYKYFNLSDTVRYLILDKYIDGISKMNLKCINVAINKRIIKNQNYPVLDNSIKYLVQRMENDLDHNHSASNFLMITDPGRVGVIRKTTRRIQRFNPIPSMHENGCSYRQEIKRLLEDPLEKDSKQSFFIQTSDVITYVVSKYLVNYLNIGSFPNRLPTEMTKEKFEQWMDKLKAIFNLDAARDNSHGIVIYPKE